MEHYETMSIVSPLNIAKEAIACCESNPLFSASPKSKPPINTIEMKTFDTSCIRMLTIFQYLQSSMINVYNNPFLFNLRW